MPNLLIKFDPTQFKTPGFLTYELDADCQTFGLIRSGSAEFKEYEPNKWCVTAEVLQVDGTLERRPLPDSFLFRSEAGDLVDLVNGWDTCAEDSHSELI